MAELAAGARAITDKADTDELAAASHIAGDRLPGSEKAGFMTGGDMVVGGGLTA